MPKQLYNVIRVAYLDITSDRQTSCWMCLGRWASRSVLIRVGDERSSYYIMIEPGPLNGMIVLGASVYW